MKKPPHIQIPDSERATRKGSALLVTLLVVSLLLVIVLTLVAVVRMELRNVVTHQEMLQARANARLSAELAIAHLQILAGPDTRVTAPSSVSDGEPAVRRLIGHAVDSAAYRPGDVEGTLAYNPRFSRTVGYFLSHDPDQDFDLGTFNPFHDDGRLREGYAPLVDFGSVAFAEDRVAAPERPIRDHQHERRGGYAFWISDEGLKAQINITDPFREASGENDQRARRTTAQRNATERLLPAYNPDLPEHNRFLGRSILKTQLDLTGYGPPDFSRRHFHDVTLRSLGLPSNPRRGGLKRDLTAVLQETAENADGLPGGGQYEQLLSHQASRINRWRAETLALPAEPPPTLSDRHWNALNAMTLREDQAAPVEHFRENMFPPLSDLNITYDPGGAPWTQLLTHTTLRGRRGDGHTLRAAKPWNGNSDPLEPLEITPVIARINISYHYTVDWPHVALHMVPFVVLWNPYSEPISLPPGRQWHIRLRYGTTVFLNEGDRYPFRLKVRTNDWSPSYAHIINQELWTPRLTVGYDPRNTEGPFIFRLAGEGGGGQVVLPPGEAVVFTMHQHQEITSSRRVSSDYRTYQVPAGTTIELRQGLPDLGQFSFYVKEDVNKQVIESAISSPHGYMQGVSAWDHDREKRVTDNRTTWGYPFPFFLDRDDNGHPRNEPSWAKNEVDAPLEDIAVNVNGLKNWDILELGVILGKGGQGSSNLMGLSFDLKGEAFSNQDQNEWVKSRFANMELPRWIHFASPDDGQNIVPVYVPLSIPADDEPFIIGVTPSYPSWGMSWGLRLPEPSFEFNDTDPNAAAMSAPIRWLRDFNPTAPFQIRDPASRLVGSRFNRFGFQSSPMYIGGFYMGDTAYADIDSFSFNDEGNVFIGFSDFPFETDGETPKAVLYEVPRSLHEITSPASLQHARLHPTRHGGTQGNARTLADHTTNYGYMMPAHTIGNAFSHLLVDSRRAVQSFYPSVENTSPDDIPGETIPFASTRSPRDYGSYAHHDGLLGSFFPGYDSSWIYNEILWDDFIFTSDYNTRLQWTPPYEDPDYRLPGNPRFGTHRDFTESAERVLINGVFNVNSTSVAAWAMLLESMLGVDTPGGAADAAVFSRFLDESAGVFDPDGDDIDSVRSHAGHRVLSPEQIWDPDSDTGLAVEIVHQVKQRGPFLSLSDFVNRALMDASRPEAHAGALQAALEAAGLNETLGSEGSDLWINPETDYPGEKDGGSMFYGLSLENTRGRKTGSASAELTQADLLSRVGAVLQARSDTFTIRAYGSTGAGDTTNARAWCEVVVQRDAEYVDPANSPGDLPLELTPLNTLFGRRFRVISFRWLSGDEI
ncbi:MAG: hypothetical protein JJU05_09435 [Verrucomicrobia bacterium]|nr:hypothetical protein [Verrucomicrobiota bacterium]MCH8526026.1 hypothetical protein [Kiritimatiellia bacterium]